MFAFISSPESWPPSVSLVLVSLVKPKDVTSLNSLSPPFSISTQSHGCIRCGKGHRTLKVDGGEDEGEEEALESKDGCDDDNDDGEDDGDDEVDCEGGDEGDDNGDDLLMVEAAAKTIKSNQIQINTSWTIITISRLVIVGEAQDMFNLCVVMDG